MNEAQDVSALESPLIELLFRYFGDAAAPNYSATLQTALRDPYRRLRDELSSSYDLEDLSDWNYDLGNSWWIRRGDESLNLRLSFVGPFACLVRYPGEVIVGDPILDPVRSDGFTVLSHESLSRPVRIWEPETQGLLYEFLFEFDKGAPWDGG